MLIGARRTSLGPGMSLQIDHARMREFLDSPEGECGRTMYRLFGEVVVRGAKRRALRRTGRMASEITYEVARDDEGHVVVDVISPATDPRTGFPYPIVHEGKRVRDRRPHRSLKPALADLTTLAAVEKL